MILPLTPAPAPPAGGRRGMADAARRATELARPVAAVGESSPAGELAKSPEMRRILEAAGGEGPEGPAEPYRPAFAVVVTLGPGVEDEVRRLMRDGRFHAAHCLDEAGTALLGWASGEVCRRLGGVWIAPGCHGLPLTLVPSLARLSGSPEVEVEVLPGGMLRPEKSVAGLVVCGIERPSVCTACPSQACPWSGAGGE